jgi:hypothetical protein
VTGLCVFENTVDGILYRRLIHHGAHQTQPLLICVCTSDSKTSNKNNNTLVYCATRQGKGHPIICHEGTEGRYKYSSSHSQPRRLEDCGWSTPRPGRFTPLEIHPISVRRLGGPRGLSGRVRKILPLPGFEPRTVQPVASHLHRVRHPGRLYSARKEFSVVGIKQVFSTLSETMAMLRDFSAIVAF